MTIRRWELGLFSPSSSRIVQVAEAYGVEVSTLLEAAEAAEQDDSTAVIPIKGYVGSGVDAESEIGDLGTISLPLQMVQGHLDDYCLRASGDSLVPDGIHDGDGLLVCPDQAPTIGSLCVIDMDSSLRAVTYISRESLRVWTATGATVDVEIAENQMVGTVSWHVRKP